MTSTRETTARQRRVPPILVALLLLLVGALLAVPTGMLLAALGVRVPLIALAVITGVWGALLGRLARLDRWWMAIQLLFPVGIVLVDGARLPSWVWLALFGLLTVVYWSTFRTQVPLYLSSSKVRMAIVPLLPPGAFTFMDVGSGVGGVLTDLAAHRQDGDYHGIESAPFPWLVSWLRIAFGGHSNCHAHWGSFWNVDLSGYDVVFAYLSPVPMSALWEKVRREMRPGSTFISNTFAVDATPPDRTVQVDDLHQSTLHVWTIR